MNPEPSNFHESSETKRQKNLLPSLNSKTKAQYLRRVIRRRLAKRRQSFLYDQALPESCLNPNFDRVKTVSGQSLAIRIDWPHAPSRFVIHLEDGLESNLENPLARQVAALTGVNLLNPDSSVLPLADPEVSEITDLLLNESDLVGQILEDLVSARASQKIPIRPKAKIAPARPRDWPAALSAPAQIGELAPPSPPEDIFALFDLPEDEESRSEPPALANAEQEINEANLDIFELPSKPAAEGQAQAPALTPCLWRLTLPPGWARTLSAFVLLSFVIVLPLHAMNLVSELGLAKNQVVQSSQAGLSALESGANLTLENPGQANQSFHQANAHFSQARQKLGELGLAADLLLSHVPVTKKGYRSGKNLLMAGEKISSAAARLAEGFAAMNQSLDPSPTLRLALLGAYVSSALPDLSAAQNLIEQVDPQTLPPEHRLTLSKLSASFPLLIASLREFVEFSDLLSVILGGQGTKTYLLVFQNNTEIRATGGFMGSFAEISLHNGEIIRLNIPGGGTYDLQGSLRERIAAPVPLQLLKARFEFQDANWFADFPSSARKILEFYQDAGGGELDGVVAVNATYVAKLIGLLGEIDMPEYGRVINEENFVFEAQKIVELEYDRDANQPKAFIGDLAPILLERTRDKSGDDFLALLDFVNQGLTKRHLQVFFRDSILQRQVLNQGWGGALKWTDSDYLLIANTNLGGGKTDGVISEDVDLQVEINESGAIINTLTITRTHHGLSGHLFSGVNNVNYVRVYVPKGSQLIDADGFNIPDASLFKTPDPSWREDSDLYYSRASHHADPSTGTDIFEESGKTVFGNFVQTRPGATSITTFTYRLPFTLKTEIIESGYWPRFKKWLGFPETQNYSLTVQKQSGIENRQYAVKLKTPANLDLIWSSDPGFEFEFDNQFDRFIALLFDEPK